MRIFVFLGAVVVITSSLFLSSCDQMATETIPATEVETMDSAEEPAEEAAESEPMADLVPAESDASEGDGEAAAADEGTAPMADIVPAESDDSSEAEAPAEEEAPAEAEATEDEG